DKRSASSDRNMANGRCAPLIHPTKREGHKPETDMTTNAIPERTDVLVIGAGPGGYAAAFEAVRLGLDVTLVSDEDQTGGACLRRGCIPSKTLLHLSELTHAADAAGVSGLKFKPPQVDLVAIRHHKDKVIRQLTGGVAQLCEQRGVRLLQARARFD